MKKLFALTALVMLSSCTYVYNIQHNQHHFYFLGEDDSPEVLMEQIEIENGAGSVNLECVFEYDEEYCQARLNQERM